MAEAWIDRDVLFGDASGDSLCIEAETRSSWPTFAQTGPSGARFSPLVSLARFLSLYLLFGLFLRSNNVENPSVHTRLRSHAPSRADCKASDTLD
jgi:hypothetical protein